MELTVTQKVQPGRNTLQQQGKCCSRQSAVGEGKENMDRGKYNLVYHCGKIPV